LRHKLSTVLKDEKVVNPPKRPVRRKFLACSACGAYLEKYDTKIPIRKQPSKLENKTPWVNVMTNQCLKSDPSEPPTAMMIIVLKAIPIYPKFEWLFIFKVK
jgi:hypothetical protein